MVAKPAFVLQRGGGNDGLAGGLADVIIIAHEVAPALGVPGRDEHLGPAVHGGVHDVPALLVPEVGRADPGGPRQLIHGQGHVAHAAPDVIRLQGQIMLVAVRLGGDVLQGAVPHMGQVFPVSPELFRPGLIPVSPAFDDIADICQTKFLLPNFFVGPLSGVCPPGHGFQPLQPGPDGFNIRPLRLGGIPATPVLGRGPLLWSTGVHFF